MSGVPKPLPFPSCWPGLFPVPDSGLPKAPRLLPAHQRSSPEPQGQFLLMTGPSITITKDKCFVKNNELGTCLIQKQEVVKLREKERKALGSGEPRNQKLSAGPSPGQLFHNLPGGDYFDRCQGFIFSYKFYIQHTV